MSDNLKRIKILVDRSEVRVSEHGYNEIASEGLLVKEVVSGVRDAELVEDYPSFPKGPCVLVLEDDKDGKPLHAVWGIPKGASGPAVLITAYRPDPHRWSTDFRSRKR